jgi:chemotaxis signal transduction protein
MADGGLPLAPAQADAFDRGAVMVALGGEHYVIPLAAVEAIMPPPSLSRVPHAPSPLLGAGNLGGQVLPIVDLAALLPGRRKPRRYDGGGEVLRLRAAGGSVGVWVDRVERLFATGSTASDSATALDPETLIEAGIAVPQLASDARYPLGDAREIVDRPASLVSQAGYIVVEVGGRKILLPRSSVLELTEAPPCVAVPGAPAGFYGIGILRGEALPMVLLASLLELPEESPPGCFALMALAGHRLLLGFGRIAGLRTQVYRPGRRRIDQVFNLATAVPDALRDVVAAFGSTTISRQSAANDRGDVRQYLSFFVGGQTYALPVEAVDRIVPPQPLVGLPRLCGGQSRITGAIELHGQVVPVASIEVAPASGSIAHEPVGYVIMRGAAGLIAIGVERLGRLVALRPEQVIPAHGAGALIDSVGVLDERRDPLRIVAPDRVGGGG